MDGWGAERSSLPIEVSGSRSNSPWTRHWTLVVKLAPCFTAAVISLGMCVRTGSYCKRKANVCCINGPFTISKIKQTFITFINLYYWKLASFSPDHMTNDVQSFVWVTQCSCLDPGRMQVWEAPEFTYSLTSHKEGVTIPVFKPSELAIEPVTWYICQMKLQTSWIVWSAESKSNSHTGSTENWFIFLNMLRNIGITGNITTLYTEKKGERSVII